MIKKKNSKVYGLPLPLPKDLKHNHTHTHHLPPAERIESHNLKCHWGFSYKEHDRIKRLGPPTTLQSHPEGVQQMDKSHQSGLVRHSHEEM